MKTLLRLAKIYVYVGVTVESLIEGSAILFSVERLSFSRRLTINYCYRKEVQYSILCWEVVLFSNVRNELLLGSKSSILQAVLF